MTDKNTETEALKKDIEALRKDLKALGDDVRSSGSKRVQENLEQMRGMYDDLRKQASQRSKDFSAEIEARPLTSVFAAFGAGLILGVLFKR